MSQVPPTTSSSTSFDSIFRTALQVYEEQTKNDIASHPLAAQLQACDSPDAVLSVLQAQVQVFDQSRSADEKLTKWLYPTVHVLYAFSATLGQGVGMAFSPARVIFAGIGVLLQVVKDVRDSHTALVDLFDRIENFFRRLETYIEAQPTSAMKDIIVKIMVEVLLILGIVTKEIKQGRIKRYLKTLVGRKDIEGALRRLDRLTRDEAHMASAEVLKNTHDLEDNVKIVADKVIGVDGTVQGVGIKVQGVDNKVQGVDDRVKGVDDRVKVVGEKVDMIIEETRVLAIQQVENQVNDMNRLRFYLRRWLCPPDPSVNFNTACDAHHEGTSAWCTQGNTFANWQSSGKLLWIYGKPGSGKTILSSAIIRDIRDMSNAGSALMAYFYFDYKDTGKQDARALLSSLLIQLSDQSDPCCDALFSLNSRHRHGAERPTIDSLMLCLKDMLTTAESQQTYLILDALDECLDYPGIPSSRERVLGLVGELVEFRHPNLRLCITSRPELDICIAIGPLVTQRVSLHDESGQRQDIIDYVTFVVRTDERMKGWRDEDKYMTIEKLTEKVDGIFRWVFCQLEVLRRCFPPSVRQILKELPESLEETYERILKGINKANRRYAHRLLQCLAVAARPLRVDELADVIAVDFNANAGGIPNLNVAWCWENQEEAVVTACSSLVSIITSGGTRIVQFSHFSVKEFLTSDRLANSIGDISQFDITLEPAHTVLAQACLAALFLLDGHTNGSGLKKVRLVEYAAHYWVKHAQFGKVEFHIKDAMDQFFDMDKPHFSEWVRMYDIEESTSMRHDPDMGWEDRTSATPLHYATLWGFHGLVERHIAKHPQHIRAGYGRPNTPLPASVFQGTKVSQNLAAHGADINSRGWCEATALSNPSSVTPLHFAAQNRQLEVSRILPGHDAQANSQSHRELTPLHVALRNKHRDISRLLPDRGAADADAGDNGGKSPLYHAAAIGSLALIQMLLEQQAEVDFQSREGFTPLHTASNEGQPEIVQLLPGHAADVHVRDKTGKTPLHLAAASGHLKATQRLLGPRAEINARDGDGRTPLHLASRDGTPGVVRLLLDHDADANVRDNTGNTPLHLAAVNGSLEVVRMLLECKVKANAQNHEGMTPLHEASAKGRLHVLKLLLEHGADAGLCNQRSKTACDVAWFGRRQQIRQLLTGQTPLHSAAAGGHLKATQRLLELKAEISARDGEGRTPLHLASRDGTSDIVRLLLDHGADAHVRDNIGNTPLHLAAVNGSLEAIRMLLECKVKVNVLNDEGMTPLHKASAKGRLHVLQLLLEHGADASVCDQRRKTACDVAWFGRRQQIRQLLSKPIAD